MSIAEVIFHNSKGEQYPQFVSFTADGKLLSYSNSESVSVQKWEHIDLLWPKIPYDKVEVDCLDIESAQEIQRYDTSM